MLNTFLITYYLQVLNFYWNLKMTVQIQDILNDMVILYLEIDCV